MVLDKSVHWVLLAWAGHTGVISTPAESRLR